MSAIDFSGGWVNFPRPKTEIRRCVPLWPETVEALRAAIDERPIAKDVDEDGLCFLTRTGQRWVRVQRKRGEEAFVSLDPLSQRFSRLLKSLGINGRRGLGFYTLRHAFETIGGESRDQVAVNAIMGHVDQSMAGVYRERISDERLRAVTDTVRAWLYADG
ncbi:MAG: tyrosine-type recombinase/integrase [Planctomycetaceae bacterium]